MQQAAVPEETAAFYYSYRKGRRSFERRPCLFVRLLPDVCQAYVWLMSPEPEGYSDPIWKAAVATTSANAVLNTVEKIAHPHEPASCLIATTVTKHGA